LIEPDDVLPLLEQVAGFAEGRIAIEAARPEHPLSPCAVAALTAEAQALGILPTAQAPSGIGLWECVDGGHDMAFNIGLLRHVARADVGLAFAWHRSALAQRLGQAHGLAVPQGTYLHPVGHHGLARVSLGRWLAGEPLGENDTLLMADWLDRRTHATSVVLPEDWQAVLWPAWQAGTVRWQVLARAAATAEQGAAQHGLDALRLFRLRDGHPASTTADATREDVARTLKLDMVGLLAIGVGGLEHAQAQARDYIAIRRQGGKVIARHPAVHQMASDIAAVHQGAEVALAACKRPLDGLALSIVAGLRASQHTALCHAANLALQLHGGIGYMRDLGVEKIVRDQNMLRLQAGGLREIPAFITGLNGGDE
jgi:hypothetical protein